MAILSAFKAVENALKVLIVTETVVNITESEGVAGEPADAGEEQGDMMSDKNESGTIVEEIELEARYLVKRVKELLHEGNVRKLTVKDSKGRYLLEIPLTVGVVAGSVLALASPTMALLSAVAGFVTNVKIEVVRTVDEQAEEESPGEE